jgi:hypothetical protein
MQCSFLCRVGTNFSQEPAVIFRVGGRVSEKEIAGTTSSLLSANQPAWY